MSETSGISGKAKTNVSGVLMRLDIDFLDLAG